MDIKEAIKKFYFDVGTDRPKIWTYVQTIKNPYAMIHLARELEVYMKHFFVEEEVTWRDCVDNEEDVYSVFDKLSHIYNDDHIEHRMKQEEEAMEADIKAGFIGDNIPDGLDPEDYDYEEEARLRSPASYGV